MKIFLGTSNISSLMDELRYGFEKCGHSVFSMNTHPHPIVSPTDCDYTTVIEKHLDEFKQNNPDATKKMCSAQERKILSDLNHYALYQALQSDIAIFLWSTLTANQDDLNLLRQQGVKTVVLFCGTEARVLPVDNTFREILKYVPTKYANTDFSVPLKYVRHAEKYADLILGNTTCNLRPSYVPIWYPLVYENIPFHVSDSDEPVVAHAPSSRRSKSSNIWFEIVSDLYKEGLKFKFVLIEDMPRSKFLKKLAGVDIMCDGISHSGKLSREAMAAGCAVLTGTSESGPYLDLVREDEAIMRKLFAITPNSLHDKIIQEEHLKKHWYYYPEHNPMVAVSRETAKDRLRELIIDKQKRRELAIRGRQTVEKFCSPVTVAKDILEILENPQAVPSQLKLAFYYSVLYHKHMPQSQEEINMLNEGTDIVRDCSWYKFLHKPFRRNGLIF